MYRNQLQIRTFSALRVDQGAACEAVDEQVNEFLSHMGTNQIDAVLPSLVEFPPCDSASEPMFAYAVTITFHGEPEVDLFKKYMELSKLQTERYSNVDAAVRLFAGYINNLRTQMMVLQETVTSLENLMKQGRDQ